MHVVQQQLPDAVSGEPENSLSESLDPPGDQECPPPPPRSPPAFHVDADKGFVYSSADEAFVCQKKNHFQVSVHIGVATEPRYLRSPRGPREVDHFLLEVFGIKVNVCSSGTTARPGRA